MKYYAIFIGQVLTLACTTGETSKEEPSASPRGADASADAAAPGSQTDGSTAVKPLPNDAGLEAEHLDASVSAISSEAGASLPDDAGDGACAALPEACPLGWGCEEYGVVTAADFGECGAFELYRTGTACGFDIVQACHGAEGDTEVAFYDPSNGALIGVAVRAFSEEQGLSCWGSIAQDCVVECDGLSLDGERSLCANMDAGGFGTADSGN